MKIFFKLSTKIFCCAGGPDQAGGSLSQAGHGAVQGPPAPQAGGGGKSGPDHVAMPALLCHKETAL